MFVNIQSIAVYVLKLFGPDWPSRRALQIDGL